MADRFEMRLEEGERGRWQEAAGQAALSSFVRECVEERIAGRMTQAQGIERMAARVGDRLEGLLDAHLLAIDASLHSAQGQTAHVAPEATGLPPGYVPVGPPRPQPFDRACDNFDLHTVGVICAICGGSIS